MFRGSVKSTGYTLHPPVSPSLSLPCVTVCHHISTVVYMWKITQKLKLQIKISLRKVYFVGSHYVSILSVHNTSAFCRFTLRQHSVGSHYVSILSVHITTALCRFTLRQHSVGSHYVSILSVHITSAFPNLFPFACPLAASFPKLYPAYWQNVCNLCRLLLFQIDVCV
jgi:hypothetical protein